MYRFELVDLIHECNKGRDAHERVLCISLGRDYFRDRAISHLKTVFIANFHISNEYSLLKPAHSRYIEPKPDFDNVKWLDRSWQ